MPLAEPNEPIPDLIRPPSPPETPPPLATNLTGLDVKQLLRPPCVDVAVCGFRTFPCTGRNAIVAPRSIR
jgi:hypothetical protein